MIKVQDWKIINTERIYMQYVQYFSFNFMLKDC